MSFGRRLAALVPLALVFALPAALGAGGQGSLVKQLDSEVIALRQRIAILEKHCGNDQAPPSWYPELTQVFTGTPVVVTRQGGHALLTFQADDLYTRDTVTVREEAQPYLDLLATSLAVNETLNVVITGHSDGAPAPLALRTRYPTAWEWSLAEASGVADQLVRRYGVAASRMTLVARGPWDPVAGNDTPEGRASNRRVVILLTEGKYP